MSGHSKWASIKHQKAKTDQARGKTFSKLIREITVAAREGGGDPNNNPTLRTAMDKAKGENMPKDNIAKAIKRGTGELPGISYERVVYEGYGPAGIAVMVDVLTDNKNRTSAEVKNIFSKRGANMAGAGSVSWQFQAKGYVLVDKEKIGEEELLDIVLEAGAEDMKTEGKEYEVICNPQDLEKIKKALKEKNLEWVAAELTQIPTSTVKVGEDKAVQVLSLMDYLEENDDVQNVYANFDISEEVLEKISQKVK